MTDALDHTLRPRHVSMISIGGIIGAGFFIGASGPIALAGPGVVFTYALAGLLTVLVSIMLRDVALHSGVRGSFIRAIRASLGPRMGFIAGWTYWIIWIVTLSIEVIGAANLLRSWLHLPFVLIEILVLGIMTAANLVSVRQYGETESWLSGVKLFAIAGFILIAAIALLMGLHPHDAPRLQGGLAPNGLMALLAAAPTAVFSMSGSEVATIAALESADPARNIARLTRAVTFRVVGLYGGAIILLLCLVSWHDVTPGQSPFLLALDRLHIPFARIGMTLVILSAMLSTLNSGIYAASRVIFEMAEAGDAPSFFSTLGRNGHLPARAVLLCAAGTFSVAIIAVLSPDLVFAFLTAASGAIILLHYGLITRARTVVFRQGLWKAWLTYALLLVILLAMATRASTRREIAASLAAFALVWGAERLTRRRRLG